MTQPSRDRPLSPHLQVYKPQITSVLSILHRMTGVALWVGSLLLVAWLWAVAYSTEYFDFWAYFASHPLAKLLLIGWTFAFYYHFCNGIRHLFWDAGRGFSLENVTRSGMAVVGASLGATGASWWWIINTFGF